MANSSDSIVEDTMELILVGVPISSPELPYLPLTMGSKSINGSAGGGMKETQEMIDISAKHNLDVEVIPMNYVNTSIQRLANNDVKYRFVIDVTNTLNSHTTN